MNRVTVGELNNAIGFLQSVYNDRNFYDEYDLCIGDATELEPHISYNELIDKICLFAQRTLFIESIKTDCSPPLVRISKSKYISPEKVVKWQKFAEKYFPRENDLISTEAVRSALNSLKKERTALISRDQAVIS